VDAAVDLVAEGLGADAARVRTWTLPRAVEVAVWIYEMGEDRLSRWLPR
jgi:hypothetical protein